MTRTTSIETLAATSAALVGDYDLTGMLTQTLFEATGFAGADAGGLLAINARGGLALLSATSRAAAELETYQELSGDGPCIECVRRRVAAGSTRSEVAEAWPPIAELMQRAGFDYVLATPLRWRGTVLGGLNPFWVDPPDGVKQAELNAQTYSDILTLFVVNSRPMTPDAARERIEAALQGRTLIEQAKGVLAEQRQLDMATAHEALLEEATSRQVSLSEVAESVISTAYHNHG